MTEGAGSETAADAGRGTPAGPLEAAIFDMDGVVTDTAEAHAAAWKKLFDGYLEERAARTGEDFRPFDPESDYREYVDGKPRHDGVRSFLESRGIELPWGDPDDAPDRETICGLGNRKNRHFHAWLEENRVRTFPSTIRLIGGLRAAGIATAMFTSSRNGRRVMESAGLADLFEARVDGNDLEALGIPGKPDPAMLLEAASRLGAAPERTAVLEDAISGVEAGAAGGFGLVIGIDRTGEGAALAARGADLVVRDAAELDFDPETGLTVKSLRRLPSAWEREDELRRRLAGSELAVFLDYDGTLTPIVEDPARAVMADDMREAVDALARRCTVGLVSGRGLADLKRLVGLGSVLYAGSHGFEIELPGEGSETIEKGREFLPDLDRAEEALRDGLSGVDGLAVERKRFDVAVHYRRVAEDEVAGVEEVVDAVVADNPRLRKSHGKKVFQVQPRADWHKGRAVGWIIERLGLDRDGVVPMYVGDDLTDEDAFRALAGRGLCVAVGDEDRPTAADCRLASPDEVRRLLGLLAEIAGGDA